MKHLLKFSFVASVLGAVSLFAQPVTLQNFSAVANPASTFFYGSWEAAGDVNGSSSPNPLFVQGSGVYDFTGAGVNNSDASKVEFFFLSSANIGTNNLLSVSAQALANNAATSFQVRLIDTGANSAFASFNAASFLFGSYSTQVVQLTTIGAFNPTSIDSMIISGAIPGGTSVFNFSFDNISAVPEPSTYAAIFGALALGFVAYRRRMQSV